MAMDAFDAAVADSGDANTTTTAVTTPSPFNIPELFVNILQHLDRLELLVAMRINKTARDLIAEDPALLRAMGRKTSAGGRFYIPLGGREVEDYGDCGIALHAQGYLGAARGSRYDITVNIQFDCPSAWWSSLPLRLAEVKGVGRAIQLCQPSIKEVTLSLGCNHAAAGGGKDSHYHHVDRTVVSHTGITLGDLSDVASRLHLEHSQQSTIRIEGVDTICSLSGHRFFVIHFSVDLAADEPVIATYLASKEETGATGAEDEDVLEMGWDEDTQGSKNLNRVLTLVSYSANSLVPKALGGMPDSLLWKFNRLGEKRMRKGASKKVKDD
ncbi:hypothetical protein LTR09_000802 [Extremus antarcticus]|uniref:F-box domain-containing protein n=1 Tax=Extremus antarcticus TaxID=702011 RepID=A0AAJ0LXR8_9PEZI|nr:hypothetical protein LTR09_000802 [Extremus antarcticus]